MSFDTILALCVFAFVTSISPGPSNFMLLASGASFGFARTMPQLFGIATGFNTLLLAMGFGLGAMLDAFPVLNAALKVGGGAYLLYLAWRIGTARPCADATLGHPLTFAEAAAFQWINPKAWTVAVAAMAIYTRPELPFLSALAVSAAFALLCLPALAAWVWAGMVLHGLLSDAAWLRRFNIAMGLLLAATLWPMLR